ncbi:YgjV family protein [Alteromonas sp. C1M14]|uniref:YgjV family protein n=1 Tax=Alteromonas sp. C1M14 TaxID=2841567 RepID=UPI001C08FE7E|nr:YgjV family protein [Alteromonas sp. C1M14]MBU2979301.1 YgjV family protein [Alteromonas sp. C1M14]
MFEFLLHGFPVLCAIMSFWSNTEKKLLLLNLALCVSIASLLAYEQAWGGAVVITIAGLSTTYRLVKQKLLSTQATYISLFIMTAIVMAINVTTHQTGMLSLMPVFTFMAYRFGELYCKESGLRICMIVGSTNFMIYGLLTQTWGLAVTEMLFALSNSWYWLKLKRGLSADPI